MSGDANKEYGSPANERPSPVKLMRQTCILIRLLVVVELEKNKGFVESEPGTESDFILGNKNKNTDCAIRNKTYKIPQIVHNLPTV